MNLTEVQEYNPYDLLSTMLYIKQKFGIELFFDAHKKTAIMLDLSPQLNRDTKIIRRIIESGLLEDLKRSSSDYQNERIIFSKIQHWLVEDEYIQEERASQYVLILKKVLSCVEEDLQDKTNIESILSKSTNEKVLNNTNDIPIQQMSNSETAQIPVFYYKIQQDNTIEVTGIKGNINCYTNISIPMIIDGKLVTSVGSWKKFNGKNLRSVYIPSSVRKIRSEVFPGYTEINVDSQNQYYKSMNGALFNKDYTVLIHYSCSEHNTIYMIPNNVRVIDYDAFRQELHHYKLKVIIHEKLMLIRCHSFIGENISVEVSPENPNYCSEKGSLFNKKRTKLFHYSQYEDENIYQIPNKVSIIERAAFQGCENLCCVILSNTVRGIDQYAFSECKNFKNITLSKNICYIDWHAFSNCESLTNISLPQSLTSIEAWTFINCKKLNNVTLPDSIKKIEHSAFAGCDALFSVTVGSDVEIAEDAFPTHTKILRVDNKKNSYKKDEVYESSNKTKKKWFDFFNK